MAASVPAKPNKAGGRDERFDVVRVRSSSVDACAALQEQTANCKTRFSLEMRARPEPNRCAAQALPASCPRAARALPARAPALRRRIRPPSSGSGGRASLLPSISTAAGTNQASEAGQWQGEHEPPPEGDRPAQRAGAARHDHDAVPRLR